MLQVLLNQNFVNLEARKNLCIVFLGFRYFSPQSVETLWCKTLFPIDQRVPKSTGTWMRNEPWKMYASQKHTFFRWELNSLFLDGFLSPILFWFLRNLLRSWEASLSAIASKHAREFSESALVRRNSLTISQCVAISFLRRLTCCFCTFDSP